CAANEDMHRVSNVECRVSSEEKRQSHFYLSPPGPRHVSCSPNTDSRISPAPIFFNSQRATLASCKVLPYEHFEKQTIGCRAWDNSGWTGPDCGVLVPCSLSRNYPRRNGATPCLRSAVQGSNHTDSVSGHVPG